MHVDGDGDGVDDGDVGCDRDGGVDAGCHGAGVRVGVEMVMRTGVEREVDIKTRVIMGMHMRMENGGENGDGDGASDEEGCGDGDEEVGWGWERG